MKKTIFKGVGTALITPFTNNKIDYSALDLLINKQLDSHIDAIIILGTTGEPCTISMKEREEIIKFTINKCNDKCKVIVGCGGNDTKQAIKFYKQAQRLKADGALIVTPYYNKCTQDGIVEHYKSISNNGSLPIIIYNVPSRTGVNILPETYERLVKVPNICGIKEASGNISQVLEIFRKVGDKLDLYSGEDSLNHIFKMLGGTGTISVLSNVLPKQTKQVLDLIDKKCFNEANKLAFDLLPLINALFIEVNPIPIKAALNYLGLCKNELRLPLTPISASNYKKLKIELDKVWANYDSM